MAKASVPVTAAKVQKLLDGLSDEDRARVLAAAAALYNVPGDFGGCDSGADSGGSSAGTGGATGARARAEGMTAARYFTEKNPSAKIEQLAVAARWREEYVPSHTHTRDELEAVFRSARINFDRNNFNRDITNARTKGLFLRAKDIQLAGYGQHYVDALPDRAAAKAVKKPKGAGRRPPKRKRKATK